MADAGDRLAFCRTMDPTVLEEALRRGKVKQARHPGHEYARFSDEIRKVPRGTAVFDGVAVWGYPQIGRIVSLGSGLREHFSGPFRMEEKIDGYNVRVFRHGDEVLALTRGGYVCPFTTDRIGDLMDLAVLEERPDVVLCAEIAGPGNPYLAGAPPFVAEDVAAYVFDFMRLDQSGFLPHGEKQRLLERYGLPGVTCFGTFRADDVDAVLEVLRDLDDQGREGVVFKEDGPGGHRAKYITSNAGISDIRLSMPNLNEMPAEFFTNRILLLAAFLEEQGVEPSRGAYDRLGRALLDGLFEAVGQYRRTRHVYHRHCCRFRRRASAELMVEFLGHRTKEMQVILRRLEREGEYYVLEFDKVYPGMTGLIAHLLGGGLMFD